MPLGATAGPPNKGGLRKAGEIIAPPDFQGGFPTDRLEISHPAPPFRLPLLGPAGLTGGEYAFSGAPGGKPIVLIFGSLTCPPFRAQLRRIEHLYQKYRDRAEFLLVYVREAHPNSRLAVLDEKGAEQFLVIPPATSLEQRAVNAAICRRTLILEIPMVIDQADNAVQLAYAGWPNRMVLIGKDGRVACKSPIGPRSTDATQLRIWLDNHLGESTASWPETR